MIMFSVSQVIETQFPSLTKHPLLYKSSNKILRNLMHEREFQQFEDEFPHLYGIDFVEQVLEYFDVSYSVRDSEKARIPVSGRLVIIANHPVGSLDALALIKLIAEVRGDIKVIANQLLHQLAPLKDMVLPVDNINGAMTKETVKQINTHLTNEGVLLIFPAGEVSRLRPQGVRDTQWHKGFLKIAKSHQSDILPMFIDARNSATFYSMSMLYKPLATCLLIKEMFKQRNRNFPVRVGERIPLESFNQSQVCAKQQVKLFKKHLYAIGDGKKGVFKTQKSIALPEEKGSLQKAIKGQCELLGQTNDGKHIYLYKHQQSSVIMREIGRLREISFRAVGEGSNKKRDVDKYDHHYLHLILWDNDELEIVGAYRFGKAKDLNCEGKSHLYSATLFDYGEQMNGYFEQGLELGRSFVQPKYWGKRSLDYLWYGIGAYLKHNPEIRYLFGPVSISGAFPQAAKDLLVQFYSQYFTCAGNLALSYNPYRLPQSLRDVFSGEDYKQDFTKLKSLLANMGVSIPTLYKQYTELCEPGGVQFLSFGIDPDFNDCVDGLVLVDLNYIKSNKKQRYITNNGC